MPDNDEQLDTTPVNPADAVLGVETKACVNGLTKTNAEDVKQIPIIKSNVELLEDAVDLINDTTIPALDTRVTALENSSGGSEWEEVDVSTYTKAHNQVNTLFDFDGDYYSNKYPMIIIYNQDIFFIKKNSAIRAAYTECYTTKVSFNALSNVITILEILFYPYNIFFATASSGGNYFTASQYSTQLNGNENTITNQGFSSTSENRNKLKVYVKKT